MANDLRGSVDGWDFKAYVLGMLFYRFISESIADYIEQDEDENFSYADLSDDVAETIREETVKEKGFFILPSELLTRLTVIGKTRFSPVYEPFMPRRIQTRANDDLGA